MTLQFSLAGESAEDEGAKVWPPVARWRFCHDD